MMIINMIRRMDISRKLLLASVMTTGVCLALTSIVVLTHEYNYYKEDQLERFLTIAKILDSNLAAPLRFLDPEGALEVISAVDELSLIDGIILFDESGELFAINEMITGTPQSFDSLTLGVQVKKLRLYYFKEIIIGNNPIGYLYVEGNMHEIKARTLKFAKIVTAMFLVTIVLALFIGSILQKWVSKPIESLIKTSESVIKNNDFTLRAHTSFDDDLGKLVNRFNLMLENIEQRDYDLSEHRKTLEQKVKERTAELEKSKNEAIKASKTKGEFLAVMSHELRTPMNAIVGMTSLLIDTNLSVEQRDFTETIHNSSDSLLNLINDILDYSKIESGKLELEREPFNIRNCIEESLDLLAMVAGEKWINLGFDINEDVPTMFIGDRTRLRQILVNLLSNAAKFTEEGEIILSLELLKTDNNHATLKFAIKDTGIGIPEDKITELFHDFTQVDASTTRKYGGTGLGLAICKRLVESMQGEIWVESEWTKGSTFHFTTTFQIHQQVWGKSLYEKQPYLEGQKMIIIDEFSSNRKQLSEMCTKWGIECTAITTIEQGIEHLESSQHIDFLMIGISKNLPENRIMDLMRYKSKNPRYSKIRKIILGQKGMMHDENLEIANQTILSKPIRPQRLLSALLDRELLPEVNPDDYDSEDEVKAALKHSKILLVEDNKVNQKVATLLLKSMGIKADIASDGAEGLKAITNEKYELVLMDIQMPVMDGITATDHIRKTLPKAQQPWIIALTAHATDDFRQYAMQVGMNGFLIKPLRKESLHQALQKYVHVKGILKENNQEE